MTMAEWLKQFRAGAAQLPGWQLTEGKLRRINGRVCYCPLMAQWNTEHPHKPLVSSHSITVKSCWLPELTVLAIDAIMDAADFRHFGGADSARTALRAQLLAACGVEDN